MNKICLTGRLTADPELKTTPDGTKVCSFSIAVRRPRTKDKTDFINLVAWRSNAEFVTRFFKKGTKIEVSGTLTSRQYKDQNGINRTVFEVVIDDAEFAESKKEPSGSESQTTGYNSPAYNPYDAPRFEDITDDDGDLPF